MNSVSPFRGYAGEVVLQFMRPGTLFTIVGTIIAFLVFGAIFGFILQDGAWFAVLVVSLVLFARFAIPASRGDFTSGLLTLGVSWGEVFLFLLWWFGSAACWAVPCGIVIALTGGVNIGSFYSFGVMGVVTAGGAKAVIYLLVAAVGFLGPTFSSIIATAAVNEEFDSPKDSSAWLWDRRANLIPYFAAACGGVIVFLAVYALPVALLLFLIFSLSTSAGMAAAALSWAGPSAAAVILSARLTGAFVLVGGDDDASDEGQALFDPTAGVEALRSGVTGFERRQPSVLGVQAETPRTDPELAAKVAEAAALSTTDPTAAVGRLEALRAANRTSALPVLELIMIALRQHRRDDVVRLFPSLLDSHLTKEVEQQVCKMFRAMDDAMRGELRFARHQLHRLDEMCMRYGLYTQAWWCAEQLFRSHGVSEKDTQQRCFQIAEVATSKGRAVDALRLYEEFLALFPNSTFADYARKAADQARLTARETRSLEPQRS